MMMDPKGSSNEATFWSSLEAPDAYVPAWRPRPFLAPKYQNHEKSILPMIYGAQLVDIILPVSGIF